MSLQDQWTAASAYEDFMGRWSRPLARLFVSWLEIPPGAHWLDVGCGTGALTEAILECAEPASVVGCDPAESILESARAHRKDVRASFVVAKSGELPRRQSGYDCIGALLALNFFPDPEAGLREMRSLGARGATVSACVWDYADGMQFLRRFWDTAGDMDEAARELDEGRRFPLCRYDALPDLFRRAGLRHVRGEPLQIPTRFASFDDYWLPLLGGTGPVPSYVASLDVDRRSELARRLANALPTAGDGSIALTARAWAVRGTTG